MDSVPTNVVTPEQICSIQDLFLPYERKDVCPVAEKAERLIDLIDVVLSVRGKVSSSQED